MNNNPSHNIKGPVDANNKFREVVTWALIDPGATHATCKTSLAKHLGCKIFTKKVEIITYNYKTCKNTDFTKLSILPIDNSCEINLDKVLVSNILISEHETPPKDEDIAHLDYMNEVHFHKLDSEEVGFIISVQESYWLEMNRVVKGSATQPIAKLTAFGWTLLGPAWGGDKNITQNLTTVEDFDINEKLNLLLRREFIIHGDKETIYDPLKCHPSPEDLHALKQLDN